MNDRSLDRTLAILALLAAAIVVCLIVAAAATGFSQELFQIAPAPKEVARQLIGQPRHVLGLRLSLGFDNLFLVVYCAATGCGCAGGPSALISASHGPGKRPRPVFSRVKMW